MATRKISPQPPDITRLLFELGPRTLVLVEGPDDFEALHEWYLDFQDRLMFYVASGEKNVESLLTEVLAVSTTKRAYGITDRDFRPDEDVENSLSDPNAHLFILRRYSIENYVLEPGALREELRVLYGAKDKLPTLVQIERQLLDLCKQLRAIMAVNWVLRDADASAKHLPAGYDIKAQRGSLVQHVSTSLGCTLEEAEARTKDKENHLEVRLTTLDGAHTCTNGKHLWHQAYLRYNVGAKQVVQRDHMLKLLARAIRQQRSIHADIRQIIEGRILGDPAFHSA